MTDDRAVALYWDFENLHASLCEAQQEGSYGRQDNKFRVQEPLVDIQAVVELAASFGPIAINRAYCNWQFFGRYRDALLQAAVELIQLFPPGGGAKNGADIKLCLDAMEDIGRFGHIGTVIVVGGDSDFMPVSQKIKAAGRTLVGVGDRRSTNRHWAKSCHEFRYYENLVGAPQGPSVQAQRGQPGGAGEDATPPGSAAMPDAAAEIFRRALHLLSETTGDAWVRKGSLGNMIKRLDPTFDSKEHGYANLRAMVKAYDDWVEVKDGEFDQVVRLRS
ncbi:MAG: NYN domain-containing protein [Comamonadaceae bacterium]|nr:MAG: NYN domain-containing protein [Comamonadaceae bacterium]